MRLWHLPYPWMSKRKKETTDICNTTQSTLRIYSHPKPAFRSVHLGAPLRYRTSCLPTRSPRTHIKNRLRYSAHKSTFSPLAESAREIGGLGTSLNRYRPHPVRHRHRHDFSPIGVYMCVRVRIPRSGADGRVWAEKERERADTYVGESGRGANARGNYCFPRCSRFFLRERERERKKEGEVNGERLLAATTAITLAPRETLKALPFSPLFVRVGCCYVDLEWFSLCFPFFMTVSIAWQLAFFIRYTDLLILYGNWRGTF